jgi:hypothetical protein
MAVLNISDDGLLCGASKRLANASTALAIRFQPTWSDVISACFRLRNQRQSGINDSRSFSLLIVYCESLLGQRAEVGPRLAGHFHLRRLTDECAVRDLRSTIPDPSLIPLSFLLSHRSIVLRLNSRQHLRSLNCGSRHHTS